MRRSKPVVTVTRRSRLRMPESGSRRSALSVRHHTLACFVESPAKFVGEPLDVRELFFRGGQARHDGFPDWALHST